MDSICKCCCSFFALSLLQMVHALAALPPSLVSPTCLLPVVVGEKETHVQLLDIFQKQLEGRGRVAAFLSHSLYYQPLTRRLLPIDFAQMMDATAARPLLLWQRSSRDSSSSSSSSNGSLAIFVMQNAFFPAILPRSYQQLYNNFLDVQYAPFPVCYSSYCCCCLGCCSCLLCMHLLLLLTFVSAVVHAAAE